MGFTLCDSDFGPLAEHPLLWRWTNPKWNQLPPADLIQLRPLTDDKSREVEQITHRLFGPDRLLAPHLFETIEYLDTSGEAEVARDWLFARVPQHVDPLIVSWNYGRYPAIHTSAETFCRYWDDFCYPCGGNVAAWSMRDDWIAFYHDSEKLWVGRRQGPDGK
jgi:hypothetical protein